MANSTDFRVCPDTGLQLHKPAEKLMKANAVVAVVFLLVGGLFGLLIALTRMPQIHLLPADLFYLALTAHGTDILVVWVIFFEMAILYFCSSTLLKCRLATPKLAWVGFWLMLAGAAIANVAVLMGDSSVMFTSYVPLKAHPAFYFGLIIFAVGALIGCAVFFGTLVIAKDEKTYEGSVPLVTFGAITAAIIAVFTIASGAVILIPTFLWSVGIIAEMDAQVYRLIWWAFGHSSQQINVSAHIAVWYAIAGIAFGAKPLSEKVSRMAFLMYILFLQLASAHHLLVDPGPSFEWRVFNTSYAMYLAVLASMIHGLTVPASIEVAQRKKGLSNGLFEWLRKAPWGNPVFSGMFLSLLIFGFLGGITGVTMGAQQVNMVVHNTMYIPGHFHATVAGGTTLAFMALTYFLLPVLWRREVIMPKLASWQPYLFGIGISILSILHMAAGHLGVPRRHWDIAFANSPMGMEFPGMIYLIMGLAGVGAIISVIGGLSYILVAVGTILWGKKMPESDVAPPATPVKEAVEEVEVHGKGFEAPGTLVLVAIFFTFFVVYYFANWKYLATIWPIG
ncbi:MAG: cbb3-type cytochrome c oxidase subunit I [Mariprofundus sp.]